MSSARKSAKWIPAETWEERRQREPSVVGQVGDVRGEQEPKDDAPTVVMNSTHVEQRASDSV